MTQATSVQKNHILLGSHQATINDWIASAEKKALVSRIWNKDPLVWTSKSAAHHEIKNRLGWLHLPQTMKKFAVEIETFAKDICVEGFTHVVLLGMGGSSLGPELFDKTFGSAPGHPKLLVLDSTDPLRVKDIESQINIEKTLFVVSSKSGGTIELISFFKYFLDKVRQIRGDKAGTQFISITDPESPLAELSKKNNFRKVFLASADVGGRFSALSHFGLIPAALLGVDIKKILGFANKIAEQSMPAVPTAENASLLLGVSMAILAESGRDKLTIVTTKNFESFGDWAEQLVAESTGKEDVGIIPVVGEALADAKDYGKDRFFVAILDESEEGQQIQVKLEALAKHGQPVLIYHLAENYEIGGEFFRWEMATAIACALMKVNAFDQPDVQAAKDKAKQLLKKVEAGNALEVKASPSEAEEFWENVEENNYVAILAFLPDRPELRASLEQLKKNIQAKTKLAVTLGFGPRYLHSTGQLHKGGANNGVFILITAAHTEDLSIAGERYSFGQLELAQAMGDFEALESRARWMYHERIQGDLKAGLDAFVESTQKALNSATVGA